jgi:hypothetical protein
MMVIENQGAPNERTLDIEMGPDGHLEVSCPGEGVYSYSEWCELSAERQAFFQVVLEAHARILDTFMEELLREANTPDCSAARGGGVTNG